MNACTYEKLCEHEILYESYTYSEQPKTAKPTNNEKNKMLRNQPLLNDEFFFPTHIQGLNPMMPPQKKNKIK